jgi:hypothetical protein
MGLLPGHNSSYKKEKETNIRVSEISWKETCQNVAQFFFDFLSTELNVGTNNTNFVPPLVSRQM